MSRPVSGLTMTTLLMGAAVSLACGGTAFAAQSAQTEAVRSTSFTSEAPWSVPAPHNQLQWDSKGRWGLRLDMNRPTVREPDWKDVQAGAYFKVTPSLRVGAGVSLGDPQNNTGNPVTQTPAPPRVHLETAFKF